MLDAIYRDARQRVAALAAGFSSEQLLTPVPATPGWTVHDLLAHLVGGATDLAEALALPARQGALATHA